MSLPKAHDGSQLVTPLRDRRASAGTGSTAKGATVPAYKLETDKGGMRE